MKHQFIGLISTIMLAACGAADDANRVVGELASDRIELTAEFSEPVVEIAVAEGASVLSGQILLRQDDARAQARLAEAEAAHLQMKARLDELVRGPRSEQISATRATVEGGPEECGPSQSRFVGSGNQTHPERRHDPGFGVASVCWKTVAG